MTVRNPTGDLVPDGGIVAEDTLSRLIRFPSRFYPDSFMKLDFGFVSLINYAVWGSIAFAVFWLIRRAR